MLLIVRILVGGLFLFSGFIKAVDPKGFGFKLQDYFEVFEMQFLSPYATGLAIFICVFEIALGVALILGYKPKPVAWLLLLMIVFFTFLTGFTFLSGYVNPAAYNAEAKKNAIEKGEEINTFQAFNKNHMKVSDCGCFGDAIPLTPRTSFFKDLILSALIIYIFKKRKEIKLIGTDRMAFYSVNVLSAATFVFSYYNFTFDPVMDFRPYKVGNNIAELMKMPEGAPIDSFVILWKYKVNGEVKEYTTEQEPWSIEGAEYVDRTDKLVREGYKPPIHDFTISSEDGVDMTDSILKMDKVLMIVSYEPSSAKIDRFKLFNAVTELQKEGYFCFVISSATSDLTQKIKLESKLDLPFYSGDKTTLKTIIRSNPGLLAIKNGKVVGKWAGNLLPVKEVIKNSFN